MDAKGQAHVAKVKNRLPMQTPKQHVNNQLRSRFRNKALILHQTQRQQLAKQNVNLNVMFQQVTRSQKSLLLVAGHQNKNKCKPPAQ